MPRPKKSATTTETDESTTTPPEETNKDKVVDPNRPKLGSPEWNRYVLNKLTEDEIIDGNPKIDGLRRVATVLFGRFNKTHRFDYLPKVWDGKEPVVMTCRLEFKSGTIIEGSAEVWTANTPPAYMNYPVSSADTRSEGKALKLALGLTKTLTYEEMQQQEVINNTEAINESLIGMLQTLEKRTGISARKVGILLASKAGKEFKSIEELTIEQARRIIEKISEINERGTPEEREEVKVG